MQKEGSRIAASQGIWRRGKFILGLTNSGVRHVYKESMGYERGDTGGVDTGEGDKVKYTYGEKWGVQ